MKRPHRPRLRSALLVAVLAASTGAAADATSDYRRGFDAYHRGDLPTAMRLLRQAADAGSGPAASFLGFVLDQAEEDAAAAAMYRRAVQLGDPGGRYGLGTLYAKGEGVERDHAEAVEQFRAAAEAGHADAMTALASAYLDGELGLAVDRELGLEWLRRAAATGHVPASNRLAAEQSQ